MHLQPKLFYEGIALSTGGVFDETRCYAPCVVRFKDEWLLYYIGSSEDAALRKGYHLLVARSSDGRTFKKVEQEILKMPSDVKPYSPEVFEKECGCLALYYARNDGKGYKVYRTSSEQPTLFSEEGKGVIDTAPHFSASVHTPRFLRKGGALWRCYVAGSQTHEKLVSKKYPEYAVSKDFRLFTAATRDGKTFADFQPVVIEGAESFGNIYGHCVFLHENITCLIFTAFDGDQCKLYFTSSQDGISFSRGALLFEPRLDLGEIGMYSSYVVESSPGCYRLFYASRGREKYHGIKTALITF